MLFGLLAALCWGSADFAARFSGRAIGPAAALFAVMAVGALAMAAWMTIGGRPFPAGLSPWVVGHGVAGVAGLLLLYEGLRRGRVTTVVPLAGAFPAWALAALVVFDGVRPGAAQWAAMGAVMAGVWMVSRFALPAEGPSGDGRGTRAAALGSGLLMGISLFLAQRAVPIHGEEGTLLIARGLGGLLLAAPVLARPRALAPALRWLPLLVVQGMLDTGGFLALLLAGRGENAAEATVVSSAFGLVTIALARLALREPVTGRQWLGIGLTFGGVAVLAAGG